MGPSNPFGVWLTPQDTIEAGMGDELAVVQIKLADNLWPYPTGKSAMVHYRVDRPRDALNALRPQASGDQLRLRFRESPDPHAELAALLARFVDRFGALPRDNQENPT